MAKYYPRWIGSIQKDTGHLSCAELGAYDRLLDHYYSTESPLPGDVDACCRIARAMTKDERKAVASVLCEFFTLDDGQYHQERADREIAKIQSLVSVSQNNGKKGGRPKKTQSDTDYPQNITHKKPSGFSAGNPELTRSESYTETDTEKQSSVVSERETETVSQSRRPEKKSLTHSLTPVEIFPMRHDWTPSIEFESMLPPALITDCATAIRDLQEFVLYRMGTGEQHTQAQWENLYLKNLEANKRHREASCA